MKYFFFLITLLLSIPLFAQEQHKHRHGDSSPIYQGDTIIWFGADFSLFRLTNSRKVGKDDKYREYIYAWNFEFDHTLANTRIAAYLEKPKVINDKTFTESSYENTLPNVWIIDEPYTLNKSDIESQIKKVTSKNSGLGLIFIVENFYKDAPVGVPTETPSMVHGYYVWFDIKTKEIYHMDKTTSKPSSVYYEPCSAWRSQSKKERPKSKGLIGFWLQGLTNSIIDLSIHYKEGLPEEENKY